MISRRWFLTGLIAAPAVIAADKLMPVKSFIDFTSPDAFAYNRRNDTWTDLFDIGFIHDCSGWVESGLQTERLHPATVSIREFGRFMISPGDILEHGPTEVPVHPTKNKGRKLLQISINERNGYRYAAAPGYEPVVHLENGGYFRVYDIIAHKEEMIITGQTIHSSDLKYASRIRKAQGPTIASDEGTQAFFFPRNVVPRFPHDV